MTHLPSEKKEHIDPDDALYRKPSTSQSPIGGCSISALVSTVHGMSPLECGDLSTFRSKLEIQTNGCCGD